MSEPMSDARLTEIRARAESVPSGPWWWGGNVERNGSGDLCLHSRVPGHGWIDLLRNSREHVTEESAGQEWDSDGDIRDYIGREEYVDDRVNHPRAPLHFLADHQGVYYVQPATDFAVFEVARNQGLPDNTPRDHPKVYRGDVVATTNPVAEFISHSRQDVADLLAEIARLMAEPQAWHSQTLGYVAVFVDQDNYFAALDHNNWLWPTMQAAQDNCPDGYVVAPVFPMSVIGGAEHG